MTDADRLLEEFILARRAGEAPDPLAWVDRAEGAERDRLSDLLSDYFRYAPRREFDRAAFSGSDAERVVNAVRPVLAGTPESWPALLPRLRIAARLLREDLVARLADALGVTNRTGTEKVAWYYHHMEQGDLPADGVSDRVLSALASIVATTPDALRAAGGGLGEGAGGGGAFGGLALPQSASAPVFARAADLAGADAPSGPADAEYAADGSEDGLDEIDRLFLDG